MLKNRSHDGIVQKTEKYCKRYRQIAKKLFYLMHQVKANL